MKFIIITLFPEMFTGPLSESILPRAQKKKIIEFEFVNLREFGLGTRRQVDDTPYGGGPGMVLRVDVMAKAIDHAKTISSKATVILLTPQGQLYKQKVAEDLAREDKDLILISGHYEGFDERVRSLVDMELSIGEYVLTGGEIPAMVLIDSVSRLLPGVLGTPESLETESYTNGHIIEHPHFTRPEVFEGKKVPEVLLSGNHQKIKEWRSKKSDEKTKKMLEKDK